MQDSHPHLGMDSSGRIKKYLQNAAKDQQVQKSRLQEGWVCSWGIGFSEMYIHTNFHLMLLSFLNL